MVAFAVGGLLGDTLFHLLPEIFLGEDSHDRVKFVLVEPNRNLLLGVAILVGFVTFVAMDKGLRIATGGEGGHDHGHSHGQSHGKADGKSNGNASGVDGRYPDGEARKRKKNQNEMSVTSKGKREENEKEVNASVKLGGYLNLM
jgi:zinc transporter 7